MSERLALLLYGNDPDSDEPTIGLIEMSAENLARLEGIFQLTRSVGAMEAALAGLRLRNIAYHEYMGPVPEIVRQNNENCLAVITDEMWHGSTRPATTIVEVSRRLSGALWLQFDLWADKENPLPSDFLVESTLTQARLYQAEDEAVADLFHTLAADAPVMAAHVALRGVHAILLEQEGRTRVRNVASCLTPRHLAPLLDAEHLSRADRTRLIALLGETNRRTPAPRSRGRAR